MHTGLSRRRADKLIQTGKVLVNNLPASLGQTISSHDKVEVNGLEVQSQTKLVTIMLNKPVGYVCSRAGQGSKTVYDLLPAEFHNLKPVGRLDKDSSGLVLLTNDGQLANQLSHPRYQKEKVYEVEIDRLLTKEDFNKITKSGVDIGDNKLSRFQLVACGKKHGGWDAAPHVTYYMPYTTAWHAMLSEGRNRQIRRTFAALGYKVIKLHRTKFGNYELGNLEPGKFKKI